MKKIKKFELSELKSLLKVEDWIYFSNKNTENEIVVKILKINGFKVISKDYFFSTEKFEDRGVISSYLKNWNSDDWNWYILNKEEIKKWKRTIMLRELQNDR